LKRRHRKYISGFPGSGAPPNSGYDARNNLAAVLAAGDACVQAVDSGSPGPGSNSNRGYRWQTGSPGLSLTNIIITPNSTRFSLSACRMDCAAGCGTDFGHLFVTSSKHSGSANVLLGDGSVRFVKDSVSQAVWMALGSRNGEEVISSDSW
jgi:prepilin-type processing-associated H-X9-DG protein